MDFPSLPQQAKIAFDAGILKKVVELMEEVIEEMGAKP